jgi:hypothetical protein
MSTTIIKHQLQGEIPTWPIEFLFIGTFNPAGGDKVNYYYGREKNQFWKLLSELFEVKFNPNASDFRQLLKKHKIACIDMIDQVEANADRIKKILGEGYKDSEIINNAVKRRYNTSLINTIISRNPGIKVYSTWGNGQNLKEWKAEIEKLGEITPLVSPSLAARVPKGENKFNFMLADWRKKIIINSI